MEHPYMLEIAKQKAQEMIDSASSPNSYIEFPFEPHRQPRTIWDVPGYKKLFSSYSISIIGQWFDMVALMVVFGYIWDAHPFMLALIPVAYGAPQALLSQFAGVLVDRINKIRLMAFADAVSVLLTVSLYFAGSPWTALILLAIRASVNVVHYPAQASLIRELIPDSMRIKAITWNGGINQAAKIIAPLAGGALLSLFPAKNLLLVTAAAFFISACLLVSLQRQIHLKNKAINLTENQLTFMQQWRIGWKSVVTNRILAMTVSLSLLGMIVIQLVDAQFPALFRDIAPNNPEFMTWIISAIGTGSISSMYVLNRLKEFKQLSWWLCSSLVLIGIGFTGIGLLQAGFAIGLAILLGVLCGIGCGISIIISNYVIQTVPEADHVSTIAGIFQTLMSTSVFVSPLIGAAIIQLTSVRAAFISCGTLLILFAAVPILLKKRQPSLLRQNSI